MVGRSVQRDEGGKPNSAGGPGMGQGIRTSHRCKDPSSRCGS